MHYAHGMSAIAANAIVDLDAVREAVLSVLPAIRLLYIFGSHARGNARLDSDLDLAVLAGAAMDPIQLFAARQTLELALRMDVDLVDLAAANTVLRLEVVRNGTLLHQRSAEQALQFEAQVLGEYAEWMDATRSLRAAIHQRGTVYAA